MKIGIISDIHGNKIALDAILKDADGRVDEWASLGDNIGYNPWANEAMETIWDLTDARVPGNHEQYISEYVKAFENAEIERAAERIHAEQLEAYKNLPFYLKLLGSFIPKYKRPEFQDPVDLEQYFVEPDLPGVTDRAREPAKWTAQNLSQNNIKRLRDLVTGPYMLTGEIFGLAPDLVSFSHSQPDNPREMYRYVLNEYRAREFCLDSNRVTTRLNFSGHSHEPAVWWIEGGEYKGGFVNCSETIDLSKAEKAMIVVPGGGQPRDGNPETGYAILDTDEMTVEFRRLPYDIDAVADAMKETPGLAHLEGLGSRLYKGR